MKYLFFLIPSLVWAGPNQVLVELELQKTYNSCHHWAGEVSGEETKERIEEINRGISTDCQEARTLVERAIKMRKRTTVVDALILRNVDCCRSVWSEPDQWPKKLKLQCNRAKLYFKGINLSTDPDSRSTYLSLCPKQAREIYSDLQPQK